MCNRGAESSCAQGDFTVLRGHAGLLPLNLVDLWGLETELHIHRLKVVSKSRLRKEKQMLWTIFVILLVLWLLGMVSSYTMGGFIHILLVVAIAVLLINVITGRRAV